MCDNDDSVKQFCYEKIISSRSSSSSTDVRVFDKASIVLNASAMTYVDMIDWSTIVVTWPPLLAAIDNDNLRQCQFHLFSGISCHSQAVECAVRDLTATSAKIYVHNARHGMILQCNSSRDDLPKVDCKSDFL